MAAARQTTTVTHGKGLHARPASVFVQTASEFQADVEVAKAGVEEFANAKSSISVLSLGVEQGEEIVLRANGADADEAVKSLVELVEDNFDLDGEE